MDIVEKKIISISGGGFTHQTDKFLDEFVINQIIDRKIKFGFLPTASKDNLNKIKSSPIRFRRALVFKDYLIFLKFLNF